MTDDILAETLRDMQAMRLAIGTRYKWFYHVTPIGNVDGIRRQGLLPHSDASPPESVVRSIGQDAGKITCINPLGTDKVPPSVQRGPFVCLAFGNKALPNRLGLDWSYGGAVEIASVLRADEPSTQIADIFVKAVKRWGSMVVYDSIPREALRVCAKGCLPHAPERWPPLIQIGSGDLIHFG